ncbi:MAG: hypothetical protein M5U28_02860 [Sandaracinaceae bacterium]|nr:hypothetical protein [Sandaracinaceae bacterium]
MDQGAGDVEVATTEVGQGGEVLRRAGEAVLEAGGRVAGGDEFRAREASSSARSS